jgi:hypothetical protein
MLCPDCLGDGHFIGLSGPGTVTYSYIIPTEYKALCCMCEGSGQVDDPPKPLFSSLSEMVASERFQQWKSTQPYSEVVTTTDWVEFLEHVQEELPEEVWQKIDEEIDERIGWTTLVRGK